MHSEFSILIVYLKKEKTFNSNLFFLRRIRLKQLKIMPETSQDAFETLFPVKQPITAEELRVRSNSMTKKREPLNQKQPLEIRVDNPLVAAESNFFNFWPPLPSDPASLTVAAAGSAGGGGGAKGGGREARISVGELDSCYTIPEPIGYKRESSHRYALLPLFPFHICIFVAL